MNYKLKFHYVILIVLLSVSIIPLLGFSLYQYKNLREEIYHEMDYNNRNIAAEEKEWLQKELETFLFNLRQFQFQISDLGSDRKSSHGFSLESVYETELRRISTGSLFEAIGVLNQEGQLFVVSQWKSQLESLKGSSEFSVDHLKQSIKEVLEDDETLKNQSRGVVFKKEVFPFIKDGVFVYKSPRGMVTFFKLSSNYLSLFEKSHHHFDSKYFLILDNNLDIVIHFQSGSGESFLKNKMKQNVDFEISNFGGHATLKLKESIKDWEIHGQIEEISDIMGLKVFVGEKRSFVDERLSPFFFSLWFSILVTIVFVGFIAVLAAKKISRPLDQVVELARFVKNKQFNEVENLHIPVHSIEMNNLVFSLKEMAEEIRRYTHQLEEGVSFRTASLKQMADELQKKNEQLIAAVEQKSQFVGMVAHDLRNPIGVITSFITIMLPDIPVDHRHFEFLNRCKVQCEFLLDLLDELLEMSELESGKSELNISEVLIAAKLKTTVETFTSYAQKKKVIIDFDFEKNLPTLIGDSRKLLQVFTNLLSNAIKYSFVGKSVKIHLKYISSSDSFLIEFIDEGPGIPADEVDKLFQPFSRTSVRSPSGEKSTGLGLAIVSRLVSLHRGKVWAESQVGVGSKFCVDLPRDFRSAKEKLAA